MSVLLAVVSGAGVRTDGTAGGRSTDPPASESVPSSSDKMEWRKGKDLSASETDHSNLDTSTSTIVDNAERKRLLESDIEDDKTLEKEINTDMALKINDPAIHRQNAIGF